MGTEGPLALVGGDELNPGNEPIDRVLAEATAGGAAFVLATAAARQGPGQAVRNAQRADRRAREAIARQVGVDTVLAEDVVIDGVTAHHTTQWAGIMVRGSAKGDGSSGSSASGAGSSSSSSSGSAGSSK